MTTTLARWGERLGRLLRPESPSMTVGPEGPRGSLAVPRAGGGVWEVAEVQGRPCLRPDEASYYLYFVLPPAFRERGPRRLFVEVEYFGDTYAQFRVQYASTDRAAEGDGLYKAAEQRWRPEAVGLRRVRRAIFLIPDLDIERTQNEDASFRIEFRREVVVSGVQRPREDAD